VDALAELLDASEAEAREHGAREVRETVFESIRAVEKCITEELERMAAKVAPKHKTM
jgi:hypothetical protein